MTTSAAMPVRAPMCQPEDRGLFRRFLYTSVATVLACVALLAAVLWDIDVFDTPGFSVFGVNSGEMNELALAFLLVIAAFLVDRAVSRQRRHEAQLQAEQLRILRMTMRTVQDIVSNALMSLHLFRAEAEPSVSARTLEHFDDIIADTAAKLNAIADLETVVETRMAAGPGVDYQVPSPAKT
jgi:hypothetical protein